MSWNAGKILALVAIALLLASGMYYMADAQIKGASQVSFAFVTISNNIPITGLTAYLESPSGNVIQTNISSPSVEFSVYPGNYIVYIPSQKLNDEIYNYESLNIEVNKSGAFYNGQPLTYVSLQKFPVNSNIILKVSNGVPQSVYSYLSNGLELASIQNGSTFTISTTNITQTVFIQYNTGSVAYYTVSITPVVGNNYLNVSLANLNGISGYVTSTNGSVIKNLQVSIYQNGMLLGSQNFYGGYFLLTMQPGSYYLVVSSPGYLPTGFNVNVLSNSGITFQTVKLVPSMVPQTEVITFTQNFKSLKVQESITITNSTILLTLPYSNSGSLYDQMKLLNMISNGKNTIWEIMNYSIPTETVNNILFNSYSYNMVNYSSQLSQTNYGSQYGFTFTYTAYYTQTVNVSNTNTLQIYVNKNGVSQNFITYNYIVNIPSAYERSNIINQSIANVTGYTGTISISNSNFNGWLTIKLSQRVKPSITLSSLMFSWSGYFESPIVNDSSSNFTFVVPANRNFSLNASNVAFDNVLMLDNYMQMKFNWNISGASLTGYNITDNLPAGIYHSSLMVTDVGGNVNETNFTIISDSNSPTLSLTVVQEGRTLFNKTSSSSGTYVLWVNQTAPVYFNAVRSKDVLPNGQNSSLPLLLNWNFTGTKKTGLNVTYTFVKPTFGFKFVYVNITLENAAGNTITWNLQVHVNDTTPPIAAFTIYNSTGKAVTSAKEYEMLTFNASKSFAPNGGYIVSYNWTIYYANGTKAPINVVYNMTNVTSNMSVVKVSFIQYGTFKVSLEVTDQSNHHSFDNVSLFVSAVRPELEILNVTYPKSFEQGSPATMKLELKNVGLENATQYYITVTINGKVIENKSFTNVIEPNKAINLTLVIYPPSSGQYTMVIKVYAVGQPSFFNTNTEVTKAISVSQPAYLLPLIIAVVVIAIGILAYAYYSLSRRKKEGGKEEKQIRKLK